VPLRPAFNPCTELENIPSPEELRKEANLKAKGRTLRVLVAEDNKVNQLLIRKMLKHYGHEVELVGNGQLAVDKIQAGLYDMVLMDLQMPVMDGLTATKAIRKLGGKVGDIPIFALTADVLTQGRESLGAMGLTGYLTKPINWDELSDKINQVVLNKHRFIARRVTIVGRVCKAIFHFSLESVISVQIYARSFFLQFSSSYSMKFCQM